jgi:hypothetical protein
MAAVVRMLAVLIDMMRTPAIQPVSEAHPGMLPQHARTGIAHDSPDLFPAVALIAMHRALGASRFLRTEPATVETKVGIVKKALALHTKLLLTVAARPVVVSAIDPDHGTDGAAFAIQPLASAVHTGRSRQRRCTKTGIHGLSRSFHRSKDSPVPGPEI